jgi:hypothetical protein
MTTDEVFKTLEPYFIVEDKRPEREYLIVKCRSCKASYSLGIKHGVGVATGNVLSLLDHAGSHAGG